MTEFDQIASRAVVEVLDDIAHRSPQGVTALLYLGGAGGARKEYGRKGARPALRISVECLRIFRASCRAIAPLSKRTWRPRSHLQWQRCIFVKGARERRACV